MMDWTAAVVDELAGLKRAGRTFEEAWRVAMQRHPPRGRDRGVPATTLLEAARAESETSLEFFRRACADAWHGRRPALAHLRVLLEGGEVFPRAPAARTRGRMRSHSLAA